MSIIKKITALFFLTAIYCCNNVEEKAKNLPVNKMEIDNQGVNINYTDSKIGDTVLFFIHGWGINQTYWASQVAYFRKKYRVITIDLPGFGKSGKNRKSWTVEDYAKDVSAVITKLDLKNVILIGHSMSGSIIVETAIANPSNIIGIVGIDNLKDIGIVLTSKMKEEWAQFYNNARKDFKETVSQNMVQYLFAPSTDSSIRNRVSTDIQNSDTTMAIDCLENADKYPFVEKLKLLRKPVYLINSDLMPTDTSAFKKNNIECHLLNIGPTGHYPMLEKPDEFNLLLQKAIDSILK
jgi:pimeloyl-ACP methyl ester carboxylesterase